MIKFGLSSRLTYNNPTLNKKLVIEYPLTIEFEIDRNISNSLNTATFRIYNLASDTRDILIRDFFQLVDQNKQPVSYQQIKFEAGYDKKLFTIFQGNLLQAYPYRNNTEIISFLSCGDGHYSVANSYTNYAINRGESNNEVIKRLTNDLAGGGILSIGAISNVDGQIQKGTAFSGFTRDVIRDNFKDSLFIDMETINYLNDNDSIKTGTEPRKFDSSTGLLSTPILQKSIISFDTLLEPAVRLGELIDVETTINTRFNGQYRVDGLKHSGTISGSVMSD